MQTSYTEWHLNYERTESSLFVMLKRMKEKKEKQPLFILNLYEQIYVFTKHRIDRRSRRFIFNNSLSVSLHCTYIYSLLWRSVKLESPFSPQLLAATQRDSLVFNCLQTRSGVSFTPGQIWALLLTCLVFPTIIVPCWSDQCWSKQLICMAYPEKHYHPNNIIEKEHTEHSPRNDTRGEWG